MTFFDRINRIDRIRFGILDEAGSPQIGRAVSPKPPRPRHNAGDKPRKGGRASAVSEKPPYQRAESPVANGVRTFQSARVAVTGGQESPPSVKAESLQIGRAVSPKPPLASRNGRETPRGGRAAAVSEKPPYQCGGLSALGAKLL